MVIPMKTCLPFEENSEKVAAKYPGNSFARLFWFSSWKLSNRKAHGEMAHLPQAHLWKGVQLTQRFRVPFTSVTENVVTHITWKVIFSNTLPNSHPKTNYNQKNPTGLFWRPQVHKQMSYLAAQLDEEQSHPDIDGLYTNFCKLQRIGNCFINPSGGSNQLKCMEKGMNVNHGGIPTVSYVNMFQLV